MKFRGHGNAVAISLAATAVVIAATGTAVAVTATVVKIADPAHPSHVARVDSAGRLTTIGKIADAASSSHIARVDGAGRLTTIGAAATINAVGFGFAGPFPGAVILVTTATTASLALTSLTYDNGYNRQAANNDYEVTLVKVTVGASGSCLGMDRSIVEYRHDSVPAGGPSVSQTFPAPLVFKATAGKRYCIGAQVAYADAVDPTSSFGVYVTIGAFVSGGTYSGVGTAARPATLAPRQMRKYR